MRESILPCVRVLPQEVVSSQGSFHGMQTEHVSLGVDDQRDEAVLANGKLVLVDASS